MNQQQRASTHIGLMDQIQVGLIGLYVAIAGIFWIGDISPVLLANLKLGLFGTLLVLGMVQQQPFTKAMIHLVSWLAVSTVFAFATTLAHTDFSGAIDSARNFVEPALWLVALNGVRPAAYDALFRTLILTLSLFFLICLYPVAAAIGLAPVTYPPPGFIEQADITNLDAFQQSVSVVAGGYNGLRTGWGVSVALSGSLFLALYLRSNPLTAWRVVWAVVVIFGCMASIVVTGARGGSAALLLISLYGLLYRFPLSAYQRSMIIFTMLFAAVAVFIIDYTVIIPENFFRGFGSGQNAFDAINSATTGRLNTWVIAFDMFISSPFYGVGPEDSIMVIQGEVLEAHNVWLRLLAESGLALIIPVLVVTVQIFGFAFRRPERNRAGGRAVTRWPDTSLVLICGLTIAMIEPSVIFGSMNTNIAFWTAVWVVLASRQAVVVNSRVPAQPSSVARGGQRSPVRSTT